MHTEEETYMLATKLDLQIKCLDGHDTTKEATYGAVQALNLHMTCEVCGNNGHSGNDCPKTHEDAWYNNNRPIHKEVQGGISRTHNIRKATMPTIQILQMNLS
jgi:hypothetical protein